MGILHREMLLFFALASGKSFTHLTLGTYRWHQVRKYSDHLAQWAVQARFCEAGRLWMLQTAGGNSMHVLFPIHCRSARRACFSITARAILTSRTAMTTVDYHIHLSNHFWAEQAVMLMWFKWSRRTCVRHPWRNLSWRSEAQCRGWRRRLLSNQVCRLHNTATLNFFRFN